MMMKAGHLTRNSVYNLMGSVLPMLVGVMTIPQLIHTLGVDRFGVLTLTWVVMGYFSLFDLGLGRALTQIVAERTGLGDLADLPDIIHTALSMMLGLGVAGGLLLGLGSPLVINHVLKMPPHLQNECLWAFGLMAFSVPAVTLLAGLRGVLEARQRFLGISVLRLCMGILTFLGPWMVSHRTPHLFWIVLSLEVMRYGALLAHYIICRYSIPEMRARGAFHARHWKSLIRFGGWMTVSNILSPIMQNLDRFLIGSLVSVGAIAYYATPFDMVLKVLLLSNALVSVLFPLFSSLHKADPVRVRTIYRKGLLAILLVLTPILLVIAVGARFILLKWLGPDFAAQGAPVLRVLCLGVLVNALAAIPFAYIQGAARPDLTAKFHLAEAPLYLLLLWFLAVRFGIVGVAWTWTARVTIDFLLLYLTSRFLQARTVASLGDGIHQVTAR